MKSKGKKLKSSFSFVKEMVRNTFRMGKLYWKDKKWLIIGIWGMRLSFAFLPFIESAISAVLINKLIEVVKEGKTYMETDLLTPVIFYILVGVIWPSLNSVRDYSERLFRFYREEKMTLIINKKRGKMDIPIHEDPKCNDLFNRISENLWQISDFFDLQPWLLNSIVQVIIAAIIIIFFNWWVLFIVLIGTIPLLFVEASYGKQVWSIHNSKAETKRLFWEADRKFKSTSSIIELKLFQNIQYFLKKIQDLYKKFRDEERKSTKKRAFNGIWAVIFSQVSFGFIVFLFVLDALHGKLLIGTFTFALASVQRLKNAFSDSFYYLGRQYQNNFFVNDLFRFLNLRPVIEKPDPGIELDPKKTPMIVFDKVNFSYPNAQGPALRNFSLTIEPGERVALVGINGAGKTTFVKLLCRFYDPIEGKITFDGHDLKEIDLEFWYGQLGALFQDYQNYHFTVKEAIAIGRTGGQIDLEKVKAAAQDSEADIFIEEWEKSYGQMLGKEFTGGKEPSIGQWQKLALARVFYRDPRVLILDEPTSSIDAEAEAKIFDKIEQLPSDRTVILISHRFSTVRHANKIVVIDSGEIIEQGTHEDLMKMNGAYARLFELQAKGYK